jgi:hypothetical protein
MKEDQQEKQRIIQELSQQLEVHQQNFDILKRELNQVSRSAKAAVQILQHKAVPMNIELEILPYPI